MQILFRIEPKYELFINIGFAIFSGLQIWQQPFSFNLSSGLLIAAILLQRILLYPFAGKINFHFR